MSLSVEHLRQLERTIKAMQDIVARAKGNTSTKSTKVGSDKRMRRTGKELIAFKKTLAAERKKGVPVAELAKKYGVTPSYVYQLPGARSPKNAGKAKSMTRKSTKSTAISPHPEDQTSAEAA